MPVGRRNVPSYRLHKARGLAVVTLGGKDHYLGKYGSPESHACYHQLLAEYFAHGNVVADREDEDVLPPTINELLVPYLEFVDRYYVKGGLPTKQPGLIRSALKSLRRTFGHTPAEAFGPRSLKTVQNEFVRQGLTRGGVNRLTALVVQFFAWCVGEELIPAVNIHALREVAPLHSGRTTAPDPEKVRPVSDDLVEATLPFCSAQVAAMIRLQRLTGMRPNEVVQLTTGSLDVSGEVWEYTPASHKTEHHGKSRLIMIGPQAQQLLRPWLRPDPNAYLFSPAEAEAARSVARREARKTPRWPSHVAAQAARRRGRRKFDDHYTVQIYRQAIHRACSKAGISHWNPNQLRHSAATHLRRELGDKEPVRCILGHGDPATTEIYAERDLAMARSAMLKHG